MSTRLRMRADRWATSLFAALGVIPLAACGGKSAEDDDRSVQPTGTAGTMPWQAGTGGTGGSGTGGSGTGGSGTGGTIVGRGGAGGAETTNSFPCNDPQPTTATDTGYFSCNGATIRTAQIDCPSSLPRSEPVPAHEASMYDECEYDADCTQAPHGYCSVPPTDFGGGIYSYCSYGCTSDAECGEGMICQCSDPVGFCVQASCTSSAECQPGFHCASYESNPGCGGVGFACQTPRDECLTDADCVDGVSYRVCALDGVTQAHVCSDATCAVGRPFLVGDVARVAATVRRDDWLAGDLAPELERLSPELRQRLTEEWTRSAQLEHASIAAFSRFLLELLALGAPSELVAETIAALEDERRHARICFKLASEFAGEAIGPGALDVEGALETPTLARSLRTAVREGCIGETVAALEADELAAHVVDPLLVQVLERIAADERRHSELAWKFAQWALSQAPALADVLESELRLVRDEIAAYVPLTPRLRSAELARAGVMPEALRATVRNTGLRQIVEPGLSGMIAHARTRPKAAA